MSALVYVLLMAVWVVLMVICSAMVIGLLWIGLRTKPINSRIPARVEWF